MNDQTDTPINAEDIIELQHLTNCGTVLGYLQQIVGRGVSLHLHESPGMVRFEYDGRKVERFTDFFLVEDEDLRDVAFEMARGLKGTVVV